MRACGKPFDAELTHIVKEYYMAFFCVTFAVICGMESIADLVSVFTNVKSTISNNKYGINRQ